MRDRALVLLNLLNIRRESLRELKGRFWARHLRKQIREDIGKIKRELAHL